MEEKRDAYTGRMPSENTPLIQSVPVEEQRERYPHSRVFLGWHTILRD
jgi:N-acetylated-alpha-linked acidic dipeptidase